MSHAIKMQAKSRPAPSAARSGAAGGWIYSTRLHVVLYSALLVATPFVILQNYLQQSISALSRASIELGSLSIPVVPAMALAVAVFLFVVYRTRITRRMLAAGGVALLMAALAQQFTDYYAAHRFYDLQQNWHYIAYAIFAFMMYRDLDPRGLPLHRIILITFFCALLYSSFDEAFQKQMSSRVFDISDIAKDAWGSVIGITLLVIGGRHGESNIAGFRQLRHKRLSDYTRHPATLLVLMAVGTLLLLMIGSLLTDFEYLSTAVLLSAGVFAVFLLVFHCSQYRICGYALFGLFVIGVAVQSYFYFTYRDDGIIHNRYGLTIYEGIPIPFFDVMFFPGGTFRLVDKKHDFNQLDREFFLKQETDILLIGCGSQNRGGNGFPRKSPCQFLYNPHKQRGTQVILQPTPQACETFNRLKQEGKSVLFILHNTC